MNDELQTGDIVLVNRTSDMSEDTYNPSYNNKIGRILSSDNYGYCVVFKPTKKAPTNYMWFVSKNIVQLLLKDSKSKESLTVTVS